VPDVYQRLERAVTRPGRVYHQTESASRVGIPHPHQTIESWVDAANDMAREQTRPPGSAELIVDDRQYVAIRTVSVDAGAVPSCYGTSPALALILSCPAQVPALRALQHVETATLEGHPAVVLVTTLHPAVPRAAQPPVNGAVVAQQYAYASKTRLYFDAKSFLPIAATSDYVSRTVSRNANGRTIKTVNSDGRQRSTFRHAFTPTQILPPGFFTPASIGAWVGATPPD
jgi:hypothetical protein